MRLHRTGGFVAAGLAALGLLGGCGESDDKPRAALRAGAPPPVAVPKPISDPTTPAATRLASVPPRGTVRLPDGPFTDRLRFGALALRGSAVTGRVTAPDEFGDLISLVLHVAYYDAAGRLLGTGEQRFGEGEPIYERALGVEVRPARPLRGVASAVLSVPDFVPE